MLSADFADVIAIIAIKNMNIRFFILFGLQRIVSLSRSSMPGVDVTRLSGRVDTLVDPAEIIVRSLQLPGPLPCSRDPI